MTVRTYSERPNHPGMAEAVSGDIKRVLGSDPRAREMTRADVEFMLSMGLTVMDPSERARVLVESYRFVCFYGGPSRLPRRVA